MSYLHGWSAVGAAGRVISNREGIQWVIVRPHPVAEALYRRVEGLVDREGVDVPGISTATMTMPTVRVTMTTITSMSYMYRGVHM